MSSAKRRLVIDLPPMLTVLGDLLRRLSRRDPFQKYVQEGGRVDIPAGLQLLFGTSLLRCG